MDCEKNKFYVGVDGGGTKTSCVFINKNGDLLHRILLAPMNPNGVDLIVFDLIIDALISEILHMAGKCAGICVGFAGKSNSAAEDKLFSRLSRIVPPERVFTMGDQELALYAAVKNESGAVLVSGTGSICFGRTTRGETYRAGGRGYLIDDGGSGYAIGRAILSHTVRVYDGRESPSALSAQVMSRYNDIDALIKSIYIPDCRTYIASFAPLIVSALNDGDAAAKKIADDAIEQLVLIGCRVIESLSLFTDSISLTGSILQKIDYITLGVATALKKKYPRLTVSKLAKDAAIAAAEYAASQK